MTVPAGEDVEELLEDGRPVGRLVRTRWAAAAAPLTVTRPDGLRPAAGRARRPGRQPHAVGTRRRRPAGPRATWPRGTPSSAPTCWSARGGTRFVSLLDGPDWADADTSSCGQHRCWPVMVADDDGTDAVLVSPIVLGDHPSIAPESAGDLFDATEIDEILTLRVMTMTEQEKADARGTDPRAAAILARCDAMTDDAMAGCTAPPPADAAPSTASTTTCRGGTSGRDAARPAGARRRAGRRCAGREGQPGAAAAVRPGRRAGPVPGRADRGRVAGLLRRRRRHPRRGRARGRPGQRPATTAPAASTTSRPDEIEPLPARQDAR